MKPICSNIHCHNYDEDATVPCTECVKREREATPWIAKIVRDAEKERHERKIREDNKHRKDEQE